MLSIKVPTLLRKRRSLRCAFLIIVFLLLVWNSKFQLFMKSRLIEVSCKPLPDQIYALVKSRVTSEFCHGYQSFRRCGHLFYRDVRLSRQSVLSHSAEEYSRKIRRSRGTGYIDFQTTDDVFKNVEYGYVSFPSRRVCRKKKNRSAIYLSSMITADGFRPALLNFFVEHYAKLGIKYENMLFTIQISENSKASNLRILVQKLESLDIYYDIHIGSWTSESLMFHQAHKLISCTTMKDWIVVADSDEFHEYPGKNLTTFVEYMDAKGYNFANGIFLDRVSANGSLLETYQIKDLFAEFPMGCRLHLKLSLGTPKKVMIFKGSLRINRGHHRLALCWFWQQRNQLYLSPWSSCPPKEVDTISPYPGRLNVHHFKWMKGQFEASQFKASAYFGAPVGKSFQNVVDYLKKCEGICISDPKISCKKYSNSLL